MSQIPRISEAEWEVMKVLWARAPQTANEVVDALADSMDWKPNTVKTLLSRLVKKEALGFNQDGKMYSYYPLVKESECVKAESQSFLQRVYGGSLKPMLLHFLDDDALSAEEIDELKKLLEERRK